MTETALSFFARLALALRILFDSALARRCHAFLATPEAPPVLPLPPGFTPKAPDVNAGALGLLSLFQREGRLVDFLQQEIETFPDAEIGAAARVVHAGCRKALLAHVEIEHVRSEPEGTTVTLAEGFDAASVKLTGNVRGGAPYQGVLRHAGWKIRQINLPEIVAGHDARILTPAEVEL